MPDDSVTLKEYYDMKWRSHVAEHKALAGVILEKEQRLSERLETMNQFREQIAEERGHYLTREVFEARMAPLERFMWAGAALLAAGILLMPFVIRWLDGR